jgi:hypothetical protein
VQEWLKANGGAYALMFFGLAIISPKLLGAIIFAMGVLLWLNNWQRLPVRVVRRFKLDMSIKDLVFTTMDGPGGRIELVATLVNKGGAATVLHSWELELRLPNRTERGHHLPDIKAISTDRPSLSDATAVIPMPPGTLRGYLTFGFLHFTKDDEREAKGGGTLALSATDQSGMVWTFTQSIPEIVALGETQIPAASS